MLGKLFKYEFKSTAKLMLTIYAVLIAMTAIGALVMSNESIQSGDTQAANIAIAAIMIFYILSIFALFVVTYVYMTVHFYKTMYGDQGYLTHTLPVRTMTVFHVKLLTSLVWMIGSTVLLILSIFTLIAGASHGKIFTELPASFYTEFTSAIGMSFGSFIAYGIVSMILSGLLFLLFVFTSCSIGQLFHEYKVVAAVVTGIVLYFVEQIFSILILGASNFFSIMAPSAEDTMMTYENMTFHMTPVWIASLVYTLVFCAIYYIACSVILRKHINLD